MEFSWRIEVDRLFGYPFAMIVGVLFSVMMFLSGVLILIAIHYETRLAQEAIKWPTTSGRVVRSQENLVWYEFTVDGVKHTTREHAESADSKYPVGKSVTVHQHHCRRAV